MKKSLSSTGLRWLWLALLVLIIDLGTKQWVMEHMMLHESVAVMPFINLFYAHNEGAAFSFLADKGGWQRWLLKRAWPARKSQQMLEHLSGDCNINQIIPRLFNVERHGKFNCTHRAAHKWSETGKRFNGGY